MTPSKWSPQEVLEVWLRAFDEPNGDDLRDEERDALNQLLVGDMQARAQLVALSQQQAWLMWHGSSELDGDDEAAQHLEALIAKVVAEPYIGTDSATVVALPSTPLGAKKNSRRRFAVTFCFGVLLAVIGMQSWTIYRPSQLSLPAVATQAAPVGYLTMGNGCVWGSDGSRLNSLKSGVQQGDEISLQEGIADFRLASGVLLSVEGPAALILTSPSSVVLQYGKISTHVPWTVTDFKAVVGTCNVTACDSEFGISFLGRDVEVHVFSGEVEVIGANTFAGDFAPALRAAPSEYLSRSRIEQGRSLKLAQVADGMKVIARDIANEDRFATRLLMAWPLPVEQDYVDTVMESKPVGYWRFESSEGGSVKSEVAAGGELAVIGDLRLPGDDGNRVAEFNQPGAGSRLISRDPIDILTRTDYSVEVWIKPSHLHCGGVVALLATAPDVPIESHAFYIELQGSRGRGLYSLTHPGSIRFLHRDPPSRNVAVGKSCLSEHQYRLRRWQHVVAVKEGDEMRLYLDGELVGQDQVDTSLASRLSLVVGQPQSDAPRDFWFVGQLDELAIYNRALTTSEIKSHYEAIRWKPRRKPVTPNHI